MTKQHILLNLAIMLFQDETLTLGQAAELAELHQSEFQKELAKRKIPIHYGENEFLADMKTITQMK
jgi:predicted HTH domain antitoxin